MSASDAVKYLGMHPKWIACIREPQLRKIFFDFARHQKLSEIAVQNDNPDFFSDWLKEGIEPEFFFIDALESEDLLEQAHQWIDLIKVPTQLIVMGHVNDVKIYNKLRALGVDNYLLLPVTLDILSDYLNSLQVLQKKKEPVRKCLIPIVGCRGGVGATTIAINTATLWQSILHQEVCLMDFDTFAGDFPVWLDLSPNQGIYEALSEMGRVDKNFLRNMMTRTKYGFWAITNDWGLNNPLDTLLVTPEAIHFLFELLMKMVDVLFIDFSFPMNKHLAKVILGQTDTLILMTELSLSSLRDTLQIASWVRDQSPDLLLKLVINSTRPGLNEALLVESIEKELGITASVILPYTHKMLTAAAQIKPLAVLDESQDYIHLLKKFLLNLSAELQGLAPPPRQNFWKKFWTR